MNADSLPLDPQGSPRNVLAAQSCLTLHDPVDCSPTGSSVRGILQARRLEWVARPSCRGSSRSGDWTSVWACKEVPESSFLSDWQTASLSVSSTCPACRSCRLCFSVFCDAYLQTQGAHFHQLTDLQKKLRFLFASVETLQFEEWGERSCRWEVWRCLYTISGGSKPLRILSAVHENWVRSLEKMATHSSVFAWRIPWTEETGRLQSIGSQRVGHNLRD